MDVSRSIDDGFDADDSAGGGRARGLASAGRGPGVAGAGQHRRRIEEIWELRRLREQIDTLDGAAGDVGELLR
jgi:hypothetical protein